MFTKVCLMIVGIIMIPVVVAAQVVPHRQQAWMPNSTVTKIIYANGYTVVYGSGISTVSQYSGGGVVANTTTGEIDITFPAIHGDVYEAIPDGQGGWYVGGTFSFVDTVKVRNLVHINSDYSVDRTWKPNPNNTILTMAIDGNTLYVGGYFNSIANQTRNRIAALDLTTGALTNWNPNANGTVYDLLVANNLVYVGGSFTTIGGQTRNNIAAINKNDGLAAAGFAPNVQSSVYCMAADPASDALFIGGYFNNVGGTTRTRLAKLALSNGALQSWTANLNSTGYLYNMTIANNNLYIAGVFTHVGGEARGGVAAIDAFKVSGNVLGFNPALEGSYLMDDIKVVGDVAYVAGYYLSVNGVPRSGIGAFNIADGSLINTWYPSLNGTPRRVLVANNKIFIGGSFSGANTKTRERIAIFNSSTSQPIPVEINIGTGALHAAVVDGTTLYIGGEFTTVNGQSRKNLAAINLSTGALLNFAPLIHGESPTLSSFIRTMQIRGDVLYIGGAFMNIQNGQSNDVRANLAALNKTTGVPTAWNPVIGDGKTTSQFVTTLDVVNNLVYIGGNFSFVNGDIRSAAATVNATSGATEAWSPAIPQGTVDKLQVVGNTVYLNGNFPVTIGGQERWRRIAAVDVNTSLATDWNPVFAGDVNDFAITSTDIYLGGDFQVVTKPVDASRNNIAAFKLSTGELTAFNSDIRQDGEAYPYVLAIAASPNVLFAGGYYTRAGVTYRNHYTEYDICPGAFDLTLTGTLLNSVSGTNYKWYVNGDLVENHTEQNLEINFWENGVYAVEQDIDGCTVRSKDFIYSITSASEGVSSINTYPNPITNKFVIETPNKGIAHLRSVNGATLQTIGLHAGKNEVAVEQLPVGYYLLSIKTGSAVKTIKLIKSN